ncbi:E3 ubiquitin-protein ligase TRIM71-like [Lytechinus variegatus]|uniref:E3 ubiquitin-protein ligase TRIM71-like n=1 Tax=Lytechinus variegatus TaxID=7654 RepID=UPI001BB22C2F|nr:E3 ubiquitin-protein ligase TRIM71-like [Lytechinus variegatus]
MAEKIEIEKASSSSQDLICPLCLDIFDEPTILTCGHTFCRKCLKKYDLTHQDIDHMVCPLCREITKLSANRVDDLRLNASINGCVDDYHAKCGGMNAVLELRQKCTACKLQQDAVSFCRTCNNYICDKCLQPHQYMTMFEDHEIISVEDVIEGKVSIGHQFEKCSIHKQENKDMFCDDCKVRVCLRCVVVGHKVHNIKNQSDFEHELRRKVTALGQQCAAKKAELEKNIQNIEEQRHEVHAAMQKLLDDVRQAYSIKVKELEGNLQDLIEQINELKRSFEDDLNILKSKDRQRIKSICSSITLVDNDRLGHLETDSLSAHNLLCDELDTMLKEVTDRTTAEVITKKAQEKRFNPADATCLDLGKISEPIDHTSTVATTEKTQKRLNPADKSFLDLGSISGSDPKLEIMKCIDLRGGMAGMASYSHTSVAIVYGIYTPGIDIIDTAGGTKRYTNIPHDVGYKDIVFQRDSALCVSTGSTEAHVYSPNGSRKATINVGWTGYYILTLNTSPSNEILIANGANKVSIYDSPGSTLKHTVPTKHMTWQVSSTRSGLIVTSSCDYINPSVVTVYDRDGNAGESLQAPKDVYLYATVDEQDRVYVASVDCKNRKVVIRLYDLDGLNLKERVEFKALDMTLGWDWCYLVSLSPDLLAFACNKKLYFIKVSL